MVTILPMEMRDANEAVRIYKTYFEDAVWAEEYFPMLLSRKNVCALKAVCDGELGGLFITAQGAHLTYMHAQLYHRIAWETAGLNIYTADALFVEPKLRGQHIARELLVASRERMREMGVDLMLGECAVDPQGRYAGILLKKYFEIYEDWGDYKHFYIDEKIDKPCLICKSNPCICDMHLTLFKI